MREDFWGRRDVLTALEEGQIFAEAFACAPEGVLTVGVEAQSACSALFLDAGRLMADGRLLPRLLTDLAGKICG